MICEEEKFIIELRQSKCVHLHTLVCLLGSYLPFKGKFSSHALRRAFPVLHILQILT